MIMIQDDINDKHWSEWNVLLVVLFLCPPFSFFFFALFILEKDDFSLYLLYLSRSFIFLWNGHHLEVLRLWTASFFIFFRKGQKIKIKWAMMWHFDLGYQRSIIVKWLSNFMLYFIGLEKKDNNGHTWHTYHLPGRWIRVICLLTCIGNCLSVLHRRLAAKMISGRKAYQNKNLFRKNWKINMYFIIFGGYLLIKWNLKFTMNIALSLILVHSCRL